MAKIDLVGKRFNRIVIIRSLGSFNHKGYWEYKCDCGVVKKADTGTLNAGRIQSCGCLVKETSAKINRKDPGVSSKNRIISDYKRKCKKSNIIWELSDDQFFDLIFMNCHYCGIEPSNNSKTLIPHAYSLIFWNGVDRIKSVKGYTVENCVPCCRQCNMAKYSFSTEEFNIWLNRIFQFRKSA